MDVIGRYEVLGRLGAGGFATVYRVRDPVLESEVAAKVLADNWASDAELRARFVREAQLLRRIDSYRVVTVHDIGELPDGRPYFVMSLANRGTLDDRLQAPITPSWDSIHALSAHVNECVKAVHDHGMIHRDIKPSNLLITGARSAPGKLEPGQLLRPDERLVLGDFGLVKDISFTSVDMTISAGTGGYAAPEQMTPDGDVGRPTDLYAATAVMYRVVVGEKPPMFDQARNQLPLPSDKWWADAPLGAFFAKGMAADGGERYQTADTWHSAFLAATRQPDPTPDPEPDPGAAPTVAADQPRSVFEDLPPQAPAQTSAPAPPVQPTVAQPSVQPTVAQPSVQPSVAQPPVNPGTGAPAQPVYPWDPSVGAQPAPGTPSAPSVPVVSSAGAYRPDGGVATPPPSLDDGGVRQADMTPPPAPPTRVPQTALLSIGALILVALVGVVAFLTLRSDGPDVTASAPEAIAGGEPIVFTAEYPGADTFRWTDAAATTDSDSFSQRGNIPGLVTIEVVALDSGGNEISDATEYSFLVVEGDDHPVIEGPNTATVGEEATYRVEVEDGTDPQWSPVTGDDNAGDTYVLNPTGPGRFTITVVVTRADGTTVGARKEITIVE
ncbi:MAG: protein kinase [Actinomycetota bacterium]